jgi:hypothetical protein
MNTTHTADSQAVAGQVERTVRPAAWLHKAENGNIVCWTSAHEESLRLAREVGFDLKPLYDQATIDAAVAAERWRCANLCKELQGKRLSGGGPGAYWKREAEPMDCAAAIRGA